MRALVETAKAVKNERHDLMCENSCEMGKALHALEAIGKELEK